MTLEVIDCVLLSHESSSDPRTREHLTMTAAQDLADRYVAVWNERDAEKRRAAIASLWVPDGLHYVQSRTARGYPELEQRVLDSHTKWVGEEECRFRAIDNAQRLHDCVTFNWEMLGDDDVVRAVGLQFLKVDDSDRILIDYQFAVASP